MTTVALYFFAAVGVLFTIVMIGSFALEKIAQSLEKTTLTPDE